MSHPHLPFFQDSGTPEGVQEQDMLQKEKEKYRHDAVVHDLPVVPVGATVSYINKDVKTWSIGRVESHEGRSYVVATEDGRLISRNHIHLRGANVPFLPKSSKLDMPIKPLNTNNQAGKPTITPKPKAKQTPVSTPPKVKLRTRSGRLVKKPPKLDL